MFHIRGDCLLFPGYFSTPTYNNMELPSLGASCFRQDCRQHTEFLPTKCHHCSNSFCQEHFLPTHDTESTGHYCNKLPKDERAIECPKCGQILANSRGKNADEIVDIHIQNGCQTTQTQIYRNECQFNNCNKRELVPITCKQCRGTYCIKHRSELDHNCRKSTTSKISAKSKSSSKTKSKNDCLIM